MVVLERSFCRRPFLFPLRILVLVCLEGSQQNVTWVSCTSGRLVPCGQPALRTGSWLQPCLIWLISYCGGKKAQSLVSLQLKCLLVFSCSTSTRSGLHTPTTHQHRAAQEPAQPKPWVREHVWQVPPVINSPDFAKGKLIIGLKLCKNVKGKKSQDHRKNSNVFPSTSLLFASTDRSSKYLGEKCVWAFQHLANINYLRAGSDKRAWGMLRSVEIVTFKFCSTFQYFCEQPPQDKIKPQKHSQYSKILQCLTNITS